MPDRSPAPACEVAAVVVTMTVTDRVRRSLASVRDASDGRDVHCICVVNDPACAETWTEGGVRYVGTGLNLGWSAGMHAGLLGVASEYVWAVQDDLVLLPGSLGPLVRALEEDPGLAAVRPLRVDADGLVPPGSQGWNLDEVADLSVMVPAVPTPADAFDDAGPCDVLPSSGLLVRRRAWDEVGGFDPWFYPWGFVDVDVSRTFTEAGWRFRSVRASRMHHEGNASTTSPLRRYLFSRNQALFLRKWADDPDTAASPLAPAVSPWIVDRAREGRGRPRDLSLDALRHIVAVSATDITHSMAAWIPEDLARTQGAGRPRSPWWRWLRLASHRAAR